MVETVLYHTDLDLGKLARARYEKCLPLLGSFVIFCYHASTPGVHLECEPLPCLPPHFLNMGCR
jgi:hypothetical protein